MNPAWCALTGYTLEEAVGGSARTLLRTLRRRSDFYDDVDADLERGLVFHGELQSRRKGGVEMINAVHVFPLSDAEGRRSNFIVVRQDVTPHREARANGPDLEGQLERAVRGANDGLWEWVLADGRARVSARCHELADLPARMLTVADAAEVLHPEDRERLASTYGDRLPPRESIAEEVRVRAPHGTYRWVQVRATVFRDASGEVERIAGAITDIQAMKDAEAREIAAAMRDPVTGLPDRGLFVVRLAEAIAESPADESTVFGVLYVDLRKFKQVNDRLGHAAGDAVLVAVGQRVASVVRPGDTVARLGGDEFGVLLRAVYGHEQLAAAAARIEAALREDFLVDGRSVRIAGAVGAVAGGASSTVYALLRESDAAMYAARAAGREGFVVADDTVRALLHRRALLERDLPGALASGAITVALQAIVPIGGGAPIGVEALARWNHPEVGAVPPLEFLQIADDLDLGGVVSARIASLAVQWAVEARAAGLMEPSFAVHVNASARQITDPRFLAAAVDAARTLEGWARLFVEITETALMERPEEIGATLRALAVEGVGIALDDFGTGWSSLVHLRVLPVGCLMIDGSFIGAVTTDPKAAEIVRSLAALARALDITVVAEGVESWAVARAAADLGCGAAQGYLYGAALGGALAMSLFDDLRRAWVPDAPPFGSADPG